MLSTRQTNGLTHFAVPVNRVSALFDHLLNDDVFMPVAGQRAWSVTLSMWEDEDNYYVEVDSPGMTENDIDVAVQHGDLLITGERKCERRGQGYDTRKYGRFAQRISLPAAAQTDKVDAKLANGVLSLTFPKGDEVRPRQIALRTE